MAKNVGLNIGCGPLIVDETNDIKFINIDMDPQYATFAEQKKAIFLQHDVRDGLPFEEKSVYFINISQTFEHFDYYQAFELLAECKKVMKEGGVIRISCPNAKLLIDSYLEGMMDNFNNVQPPIYTETKSQMSKLMMLLFGALARQKDYTGHRMGYDFQGLEEILQKSGFRTVQRMDFDEILDAPVARNHQLAVQAIC